MVLQELLIEATNRAMILYVRVISRSILAEQVQLISDS